jgi:hypothetical protein
MTRIISGAEIVLPGTIIYAVNDLLILSAQIERFLGAAEVEAEVVADIALRVFLRMTSMDLLRLGGLNDLRPVPKVSVPDPCGTSRSPQWHGQPKAV